MRFVSGALYKIIAQQRMTQRVRMDSDLMRASRHQFRFKQDMIRIPLKNLESRLGRFSVFIIHHGAMFMSNIDS